MAQQTRTREELTSTGYNTVDDGSFPYSIRVISKRFERVDSERRLKPKKNGFLKPNPFEVEKFKIDGDYSEEDGVGWTYGSSHIYISGNRALAAVTSAPSWSAFPTQPGPLVEQYELVTENAKRDVFVKANAPAVFDLSPVLAELKETLSYISKVMKGFLAIVKNGKFAKDLGKRLLSPESLWLEYRYAIMPLILTITDAIEAFEGGTCVGTYDAKVELERVRNTFRAPWWTWTGSEAAMCETIDDVHAVSRIYVKTQCDPNPLGTGLVDIVRGYWEVVKLSFVLDWFVGVGDWLTSIRNTNLEMEGSYVTTVVDRRGSVWWDTGTNVSSSDPERRQTFHHFNMKREVDIEPPLHPILQAERLSAFRIADGITLIIAILKGILSRRR